MRKIRYNKGTNLSAKHNKTLQNHPQWLYQKTPTQVARTEKEMRR